MKWAKAIKQIRTNSLLSQKDFADAIGVSFSTVNRWENNRATPNFRALKKISNYCHNNNIPFYLFDELLGERKI